MNALKTASTHPVSHVTFSPDGSTFAVAQPHYGVSTYDRATYQVVATIPIPRVAHFTAITFCDGGAKLAVGSPRGVQLFDVATGKPIGHHNSWLCSHVALAERSGELYVANHAGVRRLPLPSSSTDNVPWSDPRAMRSVAVVRALSPGCRWAVGLRPRTRPVLLDVDSGRSVAEIDHRSRAGTGPVPTFAFAPNGERFAVCDGNDVLVFDLGDVDSGHEEEPDPTPSLFQRATGVAVAPKPRLLLQHVFCLDHPAVVAATSSWWQPPVAFTPDGRGLLVRRPRNRVQLWDVATGCRVGEWSWRVEGVTCLAVAPDGLTAALGARFGRVVMWDLE